MEPPRFFWGGGRLFISSHRLAFEGDASSLVFVSVRMRLQLGFINVCVHFLGGFAHVFTFHMGHIIWVRLSWSRRKLRRSQIIRLPNLLLLLTEAQIGCQSVAAYGKMRTKWKLLWKRKKRTDSTTSIFQPKVKAAAVECPVFTKALRLHSWMQSNTTVLP